MSYKAGLAAMGGEIVGGTIIRFPAEVRSHIAQTGADIDVFYRDVLRWAAGKTSEPDKAAVKGFIEFHNRWRASTVDDIEDSENWRRRLIGWRRTFIQRGMQPTTPDPELLQHREPYIVPVLIGAGGAFLGAYLIEKFVRGNK